MAKGLIERSTLTAIADAIRAKTGSSDQMLPSEMGGLIEAIEVGGAEMLSGTFTPTAETKTAQLGQALDLSGNYALFILMVGVTGSNMSGTYHFTAGSVVSWDGNVQYRATCNPVTSIDQGNNSAWTVGSDGTIELPVVYYNPAQQSGDMMKFAAYTHRWYFIKG